MKLNRWILFFLTAFIFLIHCGVSFAEVPATKVHKPSGDMLRLESGGEIEVLTGGLIDLQSGSTVHANGIITTTGDDVDIATHVVVAGDLTVTGTVTGSNYATEAASGSFTHQLVVGETTAKSTMTPTALTLDDGLTLTVNGPAVLAGSFTAAASTPTFSSGTFANALNAAIVNTGQGDNELYDMDQDVLTTSTPTFSSMTVTNQVNSAGFKIGTNELTTTEFGNLDGQDQAVKTTSGPTFAQLTITGASEADLKVSTPTAIAIYYDSTNNEFIRSTGTVTCFDYSKLEDPAAAPDGW